MFETSIYERIVQLRMIPISPFKQEPWCKKKKRAETNTRATLSFFLLFLISLLVSVCNFTTSLRCAESRRLPRSLHTDGQCLNLPSHFFLPPCCSRLNQEPQQQTRAFCPFSSPGTACLSACLPGSHGPMIDCSLSAFVLGNCFVLLTVCLCSSPDSRDSMPPFFTYLPNMFETALNWITVEYVKVEEGWGGVEMSHMFKARRWRGKCICMRPGSKKIKCIHYKWRWDYTWVCSCTVCPLWGLVMSFRLEQEWGHFKKVWILGKWRLFGTRGQI